MQLPARFQTQLDTEQCERVTGESASQWFLQRKVLLAFSDGWLCTVCLKFEPHAIRNCYLVEGGKHAQRSQQRPTSLSDVVALIAV
jgi:hypothetical protein